ncbi:MAG: hypothetical protein AAF497_23720, partial [Planctomycetota bacterium]
MKKNSHRFRPNIEALENRVMLTAECTLRAAIEQSNASAGAQAITFNGASGLGVFSVNSEGDLGDIDLTDGVCDTGGQVSKPAPTVQTI